MRSLPIFACCGWLTLLACLPAARTQEKPTATVIDPATIAAYEKLGASCHMRAHITDNGLHYSLGFPPSERCVPAVSFGGDPQGELSDISVPFCLRFSHGALTEARLKHLAGLKNLVALDVDGYAITDATLKDVAGIKKLRALTLYNSQLTGVGLKQLAGLQNLTVLHLQGPQLTDAGLKELVDLKKLTVLGLSSPKVTPAGLKELANGKSLRTLALESHLFTDANLRVLREVGLLHKLRQAAGKADARPTSPDEVVTLRLPGEQLTDVGLKEFATFNNLTFLELPDTLVTDTGLKEVAGFKQLSTLVLRQTRVTDAGLTALEPLKNLSYLDLRDTRVTATGLLYLREALPKCNVER